MSALLRCAAVQKATLGPFRLLEPFVTRALTVTWRAEQEGLGRTVLVKTLKPTVAPSSPFSQELDREAKVLARIRHEGVIELYEFVRTDEHVYQVLEDVGGWSLAEVLERAGRLEPPVAAAIALELSRALGHAHERGVVHKGLRPDLVRITAGGRVKIVDFSGSHDAHTPSIPEPFEVSASLAPPDYMAPEQILGEDAGPQTDVFALGVMLHEMIGGRRPFDEPAADATEEAAGSAQAPERRGASSVVHVADGGASRRESSSRASRPDAAPRSTRPAERGREVAVRIRSASPTPLGQLHPDVPRALERAVLRSMAKRREDRFDDGRAFAAAIEEALSEQGAPPVRVLLSRALAAARLADELPSPGATAARTPMIGPAPRTVSETARSLAIVLVLIVGGGLAIELGLRRDDDAPSGSAGSPLTGQAKDRGYIKVLARPWAEVYVDGDLVEVTPVARPIPVEPGKHYVTFRHPYAPDEKRSIKVVAGQTVLLDVTMRVDRPDAGAPKPDAGYSP
jgi:serine/threonine-protein kinase